MRSRETGPLTMPVQIDTMRYEALLASERRLQDIASTPKCEHGNVYPHNSTVTEYDYIRWCDGAPELRALMEEATP